MLETIIQALFVYFSDFIIGYLIIQNLIYTFHLIFSASKLSDYVKKIRYSDYKRYLRSENMIPISVLVPAFNEVATINENITSLLGLSYLEYEVIIINDGSTDNTLDMIVSTFNMKRVEQPFRALLKTQEINGIYRTIDIPNLTLIDKKNGGKADSLNAGINLSKYPIFLAVDADSVLETNSLVRVIMPFVDDKDTVAVGGIVRVANGSEIRNGVISNIQLPKNHLATFQIVEYLQAFLTGRMGWDALNSLLIISGAFGAFKKNAVLAVDGFTPGTLGEDMELVLKLHEYAGKESKKYKIKFIPDPVCWTQVPQKIGDLRRQRKRWQIGLIDSLLKHKNLIFNPKYGKVGTLAIPYYVLFEVLSPLIEFLGYILLPIFFIFGYINLEFFALYLIVTLLYGMILSIGVLLLEEYTFNKYPTVTQILKLSLFSILANFGYRQIITLFRLEGILRFRKDKNTWGVIERKVFDSGSHHQ